jgi:hypothetical protein
MHMYHESTMDDYDIMTIVPTFSFQLNSLDPKKIPLYNSNDDSVKLS